MLGPVPTRRDLLDRLPLHLQQPAAAGGHAPVGAGHRPPLSGGAPLLLRQPLVVADPETELLGGTHRQAQVGGRVLPSLLRLRLDEPALQGDVPLLAGAKAKAHGFGPPVFL